LAEVYSQKESQRIESSLTFAWLTAYYHRVETLSPLKECLDEALGRNVTEDGSMTEDAMLAMARKLNAQFGGNVKEGNETEE